MNSNYLNYLEIHLVDHCNLNCKGCGHFSSLSPPSFLSLNEFKDDLTELKKHFEGIGQLRLMGGEPLLHPNCIDFFQIARSIYKDSRISLVTNGILLPKFDKTFFDKLKEQSIEVQITFYSDLHQKITIYTEILERNGINFQIEGKTDFKKHLKLEDLHLGIEAINKCRINSYCPALKNGKIYQCSGLANFEIFKNQYNLKSLPEAIGYNIYGDNVDSNSILDFINKPDPLCSHCYYGAESFPWEVSKQNISEWLI